MQPLLHHELWVGHSGGGLSSPFVRHTSSVGAVCRRGAWDGVGGSGGNQSCAQDPQVSLKYFGLYNFADTIIILVIISN